MKGRKRLEEIRERLIDVLRNVSPESAGEYDISYEKMKGYVYSRDSPAYDFHLYSKLYPNTVVEIMHVLWPDISRKIPQNMEKYYGGSAFAERLKQGLEALKNQKPRQRGKPSKLDTLCILSVLSIIISFLLISNNLTGFAISNLSKNSSNWIGAVLLFFGIIGSFFWLRLRNRRASSFNSKIYGSLYK